MTSSKHDVINNNNGGNSRFFLHHESRGGSRRRAGGDTFDSDSLSSWSGDSEPDLVGALETIESNSTNANDYCRFTMMSRATFSERRDNFRLAWLHTDNDATTTLKTLSAKRYWSSDKRPPVAAAKTPPRDQTATAISQAHAAQEIIWALTGLPTVLFTVDENSVAINPSCDIEKLSCECATNSLALVCETIRALNTFRLFIVKKNVPSRTHEALQGWLQEYVFIVDSQLTDFTTNGTLLSLCINMNDFMIQILSIHSVLKWILVEDFESGIVYEKVSRILNCIFAAIKMSFYRSNSLSLTGQSKATFLSLLIDLFVSVLKPFCEIIEHWLTTGMLLDSKREFCIVGRKASSEFKILDSKCVVMTSVIDDLILAGKSTNLLQQCSIRSPGSTVGSEMSFPSKSESTVESIFRTWTVALGLVGDGSMEAMKCSGEQRSVSVDPDDPYHVKRRVAALRPISFNGVFGDLERMSSCGGGAEGNKRRSWLSSRISTDSDRRSAGLSNYSLASACDETPPREENDLLICSADDIIKLFQRTVSLRCTAICQNLMSRLRDEFNLRRLLLELKSVFCLYGISDLCFALLEEKSHLASAFASDIALKNRSTASLAYGRSQTEDMAVQADSEIAYWSKNVALFNAILHTCLAQCGFHDSSGRWFVSVRSSSTMVRQHRDSSASLDPNSSPTPSRRSGDSPSRMPRNSNRFDAISLNLQVDWPVGHLISEQHLTSYNELTRVLLVLWSARSKLSYLSVRELRGVLTVSRRLCNQCFTLRLSINHFVTTMLTAIFDQIDAQFGVFIERIVDSDNFELAKREHDRLIQTLRAICLQDQRLEMILKPLLRVCSLAERFASLWNELKELTRIDDRIAGRFDEISTEFNRCRTFLLSILKVSKRNFPMLDGVYTLLTFADPS